MSEKYQITGRQIAAGRTLAGLGQDELAKRAQISVPTLRRMEASDGEASGLPNNVAAVRAALEAAGVEFTNGGQPGVRIRKVFETGDFVRAAQIDPNPRVSVGKNHAGRVVTATEITPQAKQRKGRRQAAGPGVRLKKRRK